MQEAGPPGGSVSTLLLIFLLVLLLLKKMIVFRPHRFPPGPLPVPLPGLFMGKKNPHERLQMLVAKYGPVCSVFLGSTSFVLVSSYKLVKEVLMRHDFANRPRMPLIEALTQNLGIIAAQYDEGAKEQRRFCLSTLRDFGFGKKSIEERILMESEVLMEAFKQEATAFDPHFNINNAVSNIICSLVFGNRFDYTDEHFQTLLHRMEEHLVLQSSPMVQSCNTFPWLLKLPGPQRKMIKNYSKMLEFIKDTIAEHRATLDPSNPRDLIDTYLSEMEKEKSNLDSSFTDMNLTVLTLDLFFAGTETTSTTLRWVLLYMMAYPDIQSRCQKEIDEVVGPHRLPTMGDRPKMPFVDAVIHETQRFCNIVPYGLAHSPTKDVEFQNYLLPKGAVVLLNYASVLFDESQWKTPHEFNPGHFLDDSGKFVKPDAFLVFSAGPRTCLGENLARMELFLFFASLLQRFQFYWPDPDSKPNLEPKYQFVLAPHSYNIGLRPRNS